MSLSKYEERSALDILKKSRKTNPYKVHYLHSGLEKIVISYIFCIAFVFRFTNHCFIFKKVASKSRKPLRTGKNI